MLSEEAVLGFEYGYSLAEPNALTLWEAQFGDFANGAQVVFDQFISSGERKWLRMSGLVCLLPHGYEGQGPEHSSARLERFLQLCAEDNMQVANFTTPANYFHILRRQMKRDFRKPLILMTPKSLLRHKRAVSTLAEMSGELGLPPPAVGRCASICKDEPIKLVKDSKIRRVVLCSGKVYYDLYEEREKRGINDVYLLRVEQLYPFPAKALITELSRFRNAEMVWCQEEPKNMGAWSFIDPYLEWVLAHIDAKHQRVALYRPSGRRLAGDRPDVASIWRSSQPSSKTRWAADRLRPHLETTEQRHDQWQPKSAFPHWANPSPKRPSATGSRRPGDAVKADEPLVELETDKVTVEVPAPAAGVLSEIIAKEGDTVAVGALLGHDSTAAPPAGAARQAEGRCGGASCRQAGASSMQEAAQKTAKIAGDAGAIEPRAMPPAPAAAKLMAENNIAVDQVAGIRQARPGAEGRRAGRDRQGRAVAACRRRRRRRPSPRARRRPSRRCGARGAGEDDPPAPDHRAPPQGRAERPPPCSPPSTRWT